MTSEVASCAVKDDTEVEVVTHSLSSLPTSLWHMFFPRSDPTLHNNMGRKKKKKRLTHTHAWKTGKPCNNEGKKKPTKNSTITAVITPSTGPPFFTSHLITDESCFRCSQEFLN